MAPTAPKAQSVTFDFTDKIFKQWIDEIQNFNIACISKFKKGRLVAKFRGGYDDPHSPFDTNLPPDNRLHGSRCIRINYEDWTNMDTLEAMGKKYVAISYKHDLRYPDRKKTGEIDEDGKEKKEDYRAMRAPKVVVDEAVKGLQLANVKQFWHDGGFPLWRDNLPTCRGSYPYLFDGGSVLIIPPFCNRKHIDIRSWCPANYPEAARAMLIMSRYKLVSKGDAGLCIQRRRKAGVPSIAWGDVNRVWLLSEAFCGAIRGAIIISKSSLDRYEAFLAEIEFCTIGIVLLLMRKIQKKNLSMAAKERAKTKAANALKELLSIRNDVKTYRYIITTDVRDDRLKLSSFFVERMAIAGSSYESDRTLLGAVTTFLLEQKFGLGVQPQDALAELEYSDDPFATALSVSSVGNHSFPLGITVKQVTDLIILAKIREEISQHVTISAERVGNIMNQWPQPQPGLCYAGTLTNSAWKNILLKSLFYGRCRGIERDLERAMLESQGKKQEEYLKTKEFKDAHSKHLKYRFWPLFFFKNNLFSEPTDHHPLFRLFMEFDFENMPEVNQNKLELEEKFQFGINERRKSIKDLRAKWAERQRRYKLVVSGDTPVAISGDGKYYIVYLLDTYNLEGFELEVMESLSSNGRAILILTKGDTTIEPVTPYNGRSCLFDIHETPLLQVILSATTSPDGNGYLVAMRRVWSLSQNSKVSIAPNKIDSIEGNKHLNANPMMILKDEMFQDDRVIPVSLVEDKMREYAPKYSIISTTAGTPINPRGIRTSSSLRSMTSSSAGSDRVLDVSPERSHRKDDRKNGGTKKNSKKKKGDKKSSGDDNKKKKSGNKSKNEKKEKYKNKRDGDTYANIVEAVPVEGNDVWAQIMRSIYSPWVGHRNFKEE